MYGWSAPNTKQVTGVLSHHSTPGQLNSTYRGVVILVCMYAVHVHPPLFVWGSRSRGRGVLYGSKAWAPNFCGGSMSPGHPVDVFRDVTLEQTEFCCTQQAKKITSHESSDTITIHSTSAIICQTNSSSRSAQHSIQYSSTIPRKGRNNMV